MKTKPILFNGQMVRALLDGRKTQTRRLMKPQPQATRNRVAGAIWSWAKGRSSSVWTDGVRDPIGLRRNCPHGQPGDLLWVRETFAMADPLFGTRPKVLYRADDGHKHMLWEVDRWRPSLFMPRRWSRLTLRITDVRVERVQEISEEDARWESIGMRTADDFDGDRLEMTAAVQRSRRDGFAMLWNSVATSPDHCWSANPWVWVIGFEVIQQNVDALLAAEEESR